MCTRWLRLRRVGLAVDDGVVSFRMGIDLGGTKIEGVVLGASDEVVVRRRVPTDAVRGYDHIVATVAELAEALRDDAPGCSRVGVGTPGAVSVRSGFIKNSNTQCLNGRDLATDLRRAIGCDLVLENDANCFALAEVRLGAARDHEVVFGVILGTGVGGGLVLSGHAHAGRQRIAGEWGHHRIDPDGPDCYCGQRGCVEAYLSGPAFERSYEALAGETLPASAIVERARENDSHAREALDTYLDRFGWALANVINILDPDAVVLGGGMSNIDELYSSGRDRVERYIFSDELVTPILRNQLGDSAGVLGAALLGVGN